MGAIANTKIILATAVANSGTVVVAAYPAGTVQGDLRGSIGGQAAVNSNDVYPQGAGAGTVAFTFGATTITVTNNSGVTWPAGAEVILSFGTNNRLGSYNVSIGGDRNQAAAGDGSGATLQTLTASGAVTSAVDIVQLNHISVVIAATMDVSTHFGVFIVRNTSASGTAAHTLTLTNGTWDGTNTVATLNAPAKALSVFFDGNGRGQIIENTGTVTLS